MFIFEIKLTIKDTSKNEDVIDSFWTFLSSLLHNGQILEDIIVSKNNNVLTSTVVCPELDSLSEEFYNKDSKDYKIELEKLSESKLEIIFIGKDVYLNDEKKVECCGKSDFYIFSTHVFKLKSPINCGNCFKSIPLYRIYKEIYNRVLSWQREYKSFDSLQLFSSGIREKFSLNQISNVHSPLTKDGMAICKDLEKITGKPVFYYLFNFKKISIKKDLNRKCPLCYGNWLLEEKLHNRFHFKCDKCRIISSLTCY